MPTQDAKRKCIIYVDGFNLYYGAVRETAFKWLDIWGLVEKLLPDDEVVHLRYFTSYIDGATRENQETYVAALETEPRVTVHYGKLIMKEEPYRIVSSKGELRGKLKLKKPQEKMTDVNIAISMLDDAHRSRADHFVLISNDIDMVPVIEKIKNDYERVVSVYVPAKDTSRTVKKDLIDVADRAKPLPQKLVETTQFPDPIRADGKTISKPTGW